MAHRLDLTAMAGLIRTRELSPVELVEIHLARIAKLNPVLRAFIEVFDAGARRDAAAVEERLMRGETPGPLAGLPLSIKDSFDVAGHATRCGSLLRSDAVAARDSVSVARLRHAGAILLGKTSTPEFLMNYETDNHYLGAAENPWRAGFTSGGSSGGESAAIAACCSAGGIGSDGGGSIREPAHFCGIAGLKPTPGVCPATGHWPLIHHPTGFMGVGGPMARTVADVQLLFRVLAGYDEGDPFSVPFPVLPAAALPARAAVLQGSPALPVQSACRHAVEAAARLLEDLGVECVEFDASLIARAHELWWTLFTELPAPLIRSMLAGRASESHWTGTELIGMVERGPLTAEEIFGVLAARDAIRARLLAWFRDTPVLIAPGFGVTAFPHRQRSFESPYGAMSLRDAIRPVSFANLLGLPSLSVPMAVADGLPAGIQIIGAPYSEELLLLTGVRLEEARGRFPLAPVGEA